MISGFGPSVLLGIIVVLLAWALFIIQRNIFGQKGKRNAGETGAERLPAEAEEKTDVKSTGNLESPCIKEATDHLTKNEGNIQESKETSCVQEPMQEEDAAASTDSGSTSPNEMDLPSVEGHHTCTVPGSNEHLSEKNQTRLPKKEATVTGRKMTGSKADMNSAWEPSMEKTEISIMEATMNDNEWLKGLDDNSDGVLHGGESTKMQDAQSGVHTDSRAKEESARGDLDTAGIQESVQTSKKILAVSPMPQNVGVSFRVHYITRSPFQLIAVTGNHRELGNWENYVPLRQDKDGFWCNSVTLPADVKMEWKFVMVENGKIKRWEECFNRCLETTHDDIQAHTWWGCHV